MCSRLLISTAISCIAPPQHGQAVSAGSMRISSCGRCSGRWPRFRLAGARRRRSTSSASPAASPAAGSSGEVLLDVFQGELELLGIEAFGLGSGLAVEQLLKHSVEPPAFGLRFLIGHLQVTAFGLRLLVRGLQVIAFMAQSINRPFFLLKKGRHLRQLQAKLIRILREIGEIDRHDAFY